MDRVARLTDDLGRIKIIDRDYLADQFFGLAQQPHVIVRKSAARQSRVDRKTQLLELAPQRLRGDDQGKGFFQRLERTITPDGLDTA